MQTSIACTTLSRAQPERPAFSARAGIAKAIAWTLLAWVAGTFWGALPVAAQEYVFEKWTADSIRNLCNRDAVRRMAGPPIKGFWALERPVTALILDVRHAGRQILIGTLSFEVFGARDVQEIVSYAVQDRGGGVAEVRTRRCQVFTATTESSQPHEKLLRVARVKRGIWGTLFQAPELEIIGSKTVVGIAEIGNPWARGTTVEPNTAPKGPRTSRIEQEERPARPGKGPEESAPLPEIPGSNGGDPKAKGANPEVAILDPGAVDPRRAMRRYPPPKYKSGAKPLERAYGPGKQAVFAIEDIQCSAEGNWLVGYRGLMEAAGDGGAQILVLQRQALNNYPGIGDDRKDYQEQGYLVEQQKNQSEWSAAWMGGDSNYSEFRQAIAEYQNKNGGANPPWAKDWDCRPLLGKCVSRKKSSLWRCDQDNGCLSYDATRWWCSYPREFCYSSAKFGDWGSALAEKSVVKIEKFDLNSTLVYDMDDGFLPIAQDALTRVCGAEPGKAWRAHWAKRN